MRFLSVAMIWVIVFFPFPHIISDVLANWWGTEQELTDLYITENTTWNSEMDLSGYEHIYIEDDAQLTIEAGSHITLRHLVVIWGNIVAQGTIDNMITITRDIPHKNDRDPDRDQFFDEYCISGEYAIPALQFDAYADMDEDRESLFTFVKFEHMGIDHAFDDSEDCPALTWKTKMHDLLMPSVYASEVMVNSPAILYRSGKLRMKNCIFENNYTTDMQITAAYSDYLNTQGYVHIENSNFQNNSRNTAVDASFKYVQQQNEPDECVQTCLSPSSIYVQCAISCMIDMDGVHDKSRVVLKNNWYGSISGPNTDQDPDFSYYGEKITGDITYEPQDFRRSPDFASNVLFLPGIKASRLDLDSGDQLWLPEKQEDTNYLGMNNDGESANEIHVKNIVEDAYGFIPIYDEFVEDLNDLKNDHAITDFSLYAYDWRYDAEQVIKNGSRYADNEIKYPITEVEKLAQTSVSGKVTIVAHSKGGILAKAIVQELEKQGRSELVDNIILVSTPQIGTPKTIAALLHGYDEQIAKIGLTFITNEQSRLIASNMSGAYELLPSKEYFTRTEEPLITFDATVDQYKKYKEAYGKEIDNFEEFRDFALAKKDGRDKPAYDDLISASVLNEKIFDMETQLHENLDTWTPPENVKLIQIGGWGLDTMRGLTYKMGLKENCGIDLPFYKGMCYPTGEYESFYEPKRTVDGDGTVTTPSSLMLPVADNVERYWVDIYRINDKNSSKYEHSNVMEIEYVRNFINGIILMHRSPENLSQYISTIRPADYEGALPRIRMSLYSPLDIHLYDEHGNHTGPVTTMINGEEQKMIEENIPNSYYETIGEHKYVGWGTSDDVRVELDGYDTGSYTVKLQEIFVTGNGEEVGDTTEFASLPTSDKTMVNFTVPADGLQGISDLTADSDGDGNIDYTVNPQINGSATLSDETEKSHDTQNDQVNGTKSKKKKEYKKASITNWSAYQYETKSDSCPTKLKLTLTGKHFDKDAIIRIGDVKAKKVKFHNSKKVEAAFCMDDLQKPKIRSLRTISVTNPHTKRDKANKKIDISNIKEIKI